MQRKRFSQFLMKNYSRYVVAILALGLALRVAWAIAVPVQPLSDPFEFDQIAQNLASGGGFGLERGIPTSQWVPGPPIVFAFFFLILGHTYLPIVILNIFLGALIIAEAMLLAGQWFNRRVSLTTGLLLALWLNLIEFTTILASELLYCALLLGALLLWTHSAYGRNKRAIGAGLLLGAACYLRVIGLTMPFLFIALEWLRGRRLTSIQALRQSLAPIALLGMTLALVIAPWSIRNTLTFGRFILITTNGGEVLWNGNNIGSDGKSMVSTPESPSENSADRDAFLTSQALVYLRDHPLDFGLSYFKKLALLHSRESIGIAWNQSGLAARWGESVIMPLKLLNAADWYVMLALGLAGIGILLKRGGWRACVDQPAVWLWAYIALTTAVFLGQDRYHIPSIPAIAMLAAYALVDVYDARRMREAPHGVTPPQAVFEKSTAQGQGLMAKVRVIILNYRTADLTIACLRSLAAQLTSYPQVSAVVVDNASNDSSAQRIRAAIQNEGWGELGNRA